MTKLRVALITHFWDGIVQRPHHWCHQALLQGHEVHVFTFPAPFNQPTPTASIQPSPHVHRLSRWPWLGVLSRIGFGEQATNIQRDRLVKFVQTEVLDRGKAFFDVVLYAGIPWKSYNFSDAHALLLYDAMDEWAEFGTLPPMVDDWEKKLIKDAAIVLAISEPMYQRLTMSTETDSVMILPNGCDYEFFASAIRPQDSELRRKVIGYTGAMHSWFDWESVIAIAEAYPDYEIYLVGPCASPPSVLPPNITLAGKQPYSSLPAVNITYEVCLIPFLRTPLINSVSPIKLYEYLACGRPVVATPMPDTEKYAAPGVVYLADTPSAFVQAVGEALVNANEPELIAQRRQIAYENTWASRWLAIEARVEPHRKRLCSGSAGS
ncbi:MAG: glycosyltransferase [Caldilineaceae bacterium]|nr:glycosyltransferase [Caldilineaceae bacterium]